MMPHEPHVAARKTRLVIVDDEPAVRRGVRLLVDAEPDLVVCGEAGGVAEALERVPALKADLALVDLGLKQGTGFDLIKKLRQRCPTLKIVVFSMYDQVHFVAAAFAAGAHGYVTKGEGTERMLEAVRLVMAGKPYLSEEIQAKAPRLLAAPKVLHARRHG